MVFLIRFILVTLIIYLLIRSFIRYFAEEETSPNDRENHAREEKKPKGVSKEIGEYVDYEEVDD
jgi:large-conductance mechanosensitive channel